MSKRFAETICRRVKGLQEYCQKAKTFVGSTLPYWDLECNNFINNLVKKSNYYGKPTLENLRISRETIRGNALFNGITKITMPNIGCGL